MNHPDRYTQHIMMITEAYFFGIYVEHTYSSRACKKYIFELFLVLVTLISMKNRLKTAENKKKWFPKEKE